MQSKIAISSVLAMLFVITGCGGESIKERTFGESENQVFACAGTSEVLTLDIDIIADSGAQLNVDRETGDILNPELYAELPPENQAILLNAVANCLGHKDLPSLYDLGCVLRLIEDRKAGVNVYFNVEYTQPCVYPDYSIALVLTDHLGFPHVRYIIPISPSRSNVSAGEIEILSQWLEERPGGQVVVTVVAYPRNTPYDVERAIGPDGNKNLNPDMEILDTTTYTVACLFFDECGEL